MSKQPTIFRRFWEFLGEKMPDLYFFEAVNTILLIAMAIFILGLLIFT